MWALGDLIWGWSQVWSSLSVLVCDRDWALRFVFFWGVWCFEVKVDRGR